MHLIIKNHAFDHQESCMLQHHECYSVINRDFLFLIFALLQSKTNQMTQSEQILNSRRGHGWVIWFVLLCTTKKFLFLPTPYIPTDGHFIHHCLRGAFLFGPFAIIFRSFCHTFVLHSFKIKQYKHLSALCALELITVEHSRVR